MATINEYIPIGSDDWDVTTVFAAGNSTCSLGRNGSTNNKYGMRFPSVPIPPGSTIVSATITFKAAATRNDSPSVRIYGIAADSPSAPTTLAQEAALVRTTNFGDWTIAAQTLGQWFTSADFASAVQEIVNRAGWAFGNAMIITVDNVGTDSTRLATVSTRDGSSGVSAPYLTITYTHASKELRQIKVAASGDDVACPTTANTFNSNSTTLTIGKSTVASKHYFRFLNLEIPKLSTIEFARVVFRINNVPAGTTDVAIKGAAADNAGAAANQGAADAIARTSASVAWTPNGGSSGGGLLLTPDIKTLIQEIVNRSGWASGNALGLFIETTSVASNSFSVFSFDAEASALGNGSPILEVQYQTAIGRVGNMMLLGVG